ncbi:MAG: hypothetical protein WAV41_01410 [Microgenomates group bacterium]
MSEKINLTHLDADQPVVSVSPTPPSTPSQPKSSRSLIIVLIVIILLLLTAFVSYAFYVSNKNNLSIATPTSIPTPLISPTPEVTLTPTLPTSGSQISWLKKPQKIAAINAIAPYDDKSRSQPYDLGQARFYLVANLSDGSKLINVYLPTEGMGTYDVLYRFIQSSDNKIAFIDRDNQWQYQKAIFTKGVTLSSFNIRELDPPESLTIDGNYYKRGYLNLLTFEKLLNPKLIKSTDFGELYVVYSSYKEQPDLSGRMFYLKLNDSTIYSYDLRVPFQSDDQVVSLQWSDGSILKSQFQNKLIRGGCGQSLNPGPDVIKDGSSLISSREIVASWGDKKIYQVKDTSSYLVKTAYASYKVGRDYPSAPPIVSIDTFAQAKSHLLYQDSFGDWQFLLNQDYAMQAECGKPVVYLYPTIDTQVLVKVGAIITKSEPLYPQNGWSVLAHPNGQLEYGGQSYPNLFWEGTGLGIYPDKSKYGFVVTQAKLITTLHSQLKQLGLNATESADFMEFWTDKLPATPYVRLTWLNTADMNQLAPLQVSPLPQTSIRLFLDFEGLDKPISLIPQKLSAPKRDGFTLVEWGGLLRK